MLPMLRRLWHSDPCRWLLVPCAALAAFFFALYFSLFVFFFGVFPKDMAESSAGFLFSSSVVLAGAFVAPRWRLGVAALLAALGALSTVSLMRINLASTLAGSLVALAWIALWFYPRRGPRSTRWLALSSGVAGIAFIGAVYLRYVDWPARPDVLPTELSQALNSDTAGVAAFYRYDLGGFIDREWLWRVDADHAVVARVVASLGLERADQVPPAFWRMAPHYWPRSMSAGAETFRSPWFAADGRGRDGAHYFLLHDKINQRAFVWFKDNF